MRHVVSVHNWTTKYGLPEYRRWMTENGPWNLEFSSSFQDKRHNQLWRDHLLAWAMRCHPKSQYSECKLAVVYHPEDEHCATTVANYLKLLSDTSTLDDITLETVLTAWEAVLGENDWCNDFRLRYLDLEASKVAFDKLNG